MTQRAVQILEALPGRAKGARFSRSRAMRPRRRSNTPAPGPLGGPEAWAETIWCRPGALRLRDFRREAFTRCLDVGWTREQVMDFCGHVYVK